MKEDTIPSIIFALALSAGIALFTYFLIIHYVVDVESQFSRENNLLNFYDQRHDGDIFILGSSLVLEGIDANAVEDLLRKGHNNNSVYNLGMPADSPLDRLCEIDSIITARPKMVIVGLSYVSLGNNSDIFEDRMLLCYQRKPINERKTFIEDYQYIFNEGQLNLTSQTPLEHFFYQRKFISSYLVSITGRVIGDSLSSAGTSNDENTAVRMDYLRDTNFKDPWILTTNLSETQKIKAMGNKKNISWVSEELNPQKKALLQIVNKLRQNNIRVIIINMPISPLESEGINEKSHENFSDFLNSTGEPWYDFEREYNSEYFIDLHHMNAAGRTDFSSKVATLLVDNLKTGA